jgi:DNA repair protein RadC
LDECGGIAGLLRSGPEVLQNIKGIGPAKRAEIMAVLELAKRALTQQMESQPAFETSSAMRDYLQLRIGSLRHECFSVVFLDTRHHLIACDELFRGTLSSASVYPREVVVRALHHNAAAVVLAHNHPSGDVKPSQADKALTKTLTAALGLVDIRVLDHIIVGSGQSFSMCENGDL